MEHECSLYRDVNASCKSFLSMTFTFTCTRLCSRLFSKVLSAIRAVNFLFGFQSKGISTQLADFCIKMNQFNSFLLFFSSIKGSCGRFQSSLPHPVKQKQLIGLTDFRAFVSCSRVSKITNRLMVFSFLNVSVFSQ